MASSAPRVSDGTNIHPEAAGNSSPPTAAETRFFAEEVTFHEAKYLAGSNPRAQSGFGRDEGDWQRFRHAVVAPIETDGSFLDIGCDNGLLMESVFAWLREDRHARYLQEARTWLGGGLPDGAIGFSLGTPCLRFRLAHHHLEHAPYGEHRLDPRLDC